MSTSYIANLNEFSRKFLLRGHYQPSKEDIMLFPMRFQNIKAALFQDLLLFDTINIKVVGENIPLAILISEMGVRGIEELVEQQALGFTHWTPNILQMVDPIPGLLPLASGRFSSSAHIDPEESITIGLRALTDKLNKRDRKIVLNKVRDLYIYPADGIEHDTKDLVMSAYESNKLISLGIDKNQLDIYNLPSHKKNLLAKCATELLEYKYLNTQRFNSTDNFGSVELFLDCSSKLRTINHADAFSKIVDIENFPDLKSIFELIDFPLKNVCKIRNSKNSIKFRTWLDSTSSSENISEVSMLYIDAITNKNGFFETNIGKLTKTATLAIAGACIGSITGPVGAAIGGTAGALLSPSADLGLDLIDLYFINGLTKGWTPRIFIDELKQMKIEPKL